nr:unnamed protein product [Callosobruchus chinensis]
MVFVYIRIYYAAKARARRGIRKPPRRPAQEQVTSFVAAKNGASVASAAGTPRASINSPMGDSTDKQIATIESHPRPMPIPTVTCDLASDISTSDMGAPECGIGQDGHESKDTLKVFSTGLPPAASAVRNPLTACQFRSSQLSVNGELQQQVAALARCRQPSVGIDTDMVSEFDPSSSDSGVVAQCTAVQPLKLRLKPIFGRGKQPKRNRSDETKKLAKSPSERAISTASEGGGVTTPTTVVPRVQKPKDPERERRRIARKKEKRATLILGLIMGSFIACWLPFFCMYVLRLAYDIPPFAFSTAFWLGYMNSALNPVIYTIFNKDFRRAFRRILFK